jgi:hypothetical protein
MQTPRDQLSAINPATVVNAFALTLFFYAVGFKPSPRTGEGLPIRLPFSRFGRRGIALTGIQERRMRANSRCIVLDCQVNKVVFQYRDRMYRQVSVSNFPGTLEHLWVYGIPR